MRPLRCAVFAIVVSCFQASSSVAATIAQVTSTIDAAAQTANFGLIYSSTPDFFTTDSAGRYADQFRLYIAPSTVSLPGNLCVVCGFEQVADRWFTEAGGTIFASQGSDPPFATLPFQQQGSLVTFAIPFSLLTTPTAFTYLVVAFNFGSTNLAAFRGRAGQAGAQIDPFVSAVPVPATLPMFAAGLSALALLKWRRNRRRSAGRRNPTEALPRVS